MAVWNVTSRAASLMALGRMSWTAVFSLLSTPFISSNSASSSGSPLRGPDAGSAGRYTSSDCSAPFSRYAASWGTNFPVPLSALSAGAGALTTSGGTGAGLAASFCLTEQPAKQIVRANGSSREKNLPLAVFSPLFSTMRKRDSISFCRLRWLYSTIKQQMMTRTAHMPNAQQTTEESAASYPLLNPRV